MNTKLSSCFQQEAPKSAHSKTSLRNLKMNKVSRYFRQMTPIICQEENTSNKQNSILNAITTLRTSKIGESVEDILSKSHESIDSQSDQEYYKQQSSQSDKNNTTEGEDLISLRTNNRQFCIDLKRVDEMASLRNYCDFIKQQNRMYLSQIIKLQEENNLIKSKIEGDKQQQFEEFGISIGINTEQCLENDNNEQKRQKEDLLARLMELQQQNSTQLQKIIQLNSFKKHVQMKETESQTIITISDYCQTMMQTQSTANQIAESQQLNLANLQLLDKIKQTCCLFSREQRILDLNNFDVWLQQQFKNQLQISILPLKCEIKLLNQILCSNRKIFQDKQRQKVNLLKEAHQTIVKLLQQLKQTQSMAKINYSQYLIIQKRQKYQKIPSFLI